MVLFGFKSLNGLGAVSGSLDQPMVTGCFMGATFPFLFRRKWHFFIPLVVASLYCLDSAMGVLGFAIVPIYLVSKDLKASQFLAAFGLFAIGIFFLYRLFGDFFQPAARFLTWSKIIEQTPFMFFGRGFGVYSDLGWQNLGVGENMAHPHNEYLSLYLASGCLGLALFLGVVGWLFQWHRRAPLFSASLVSLLATAGGAFPFHIAPTSVILLIGFGALLHHFKESNKCRRLLSLLRLLGFLLLYALGSCSEMIKKWIGRPKYLRIFS